MLTIMKPRALAALLLLSLVTLAGCAGTEVAPEATVTPHVEPASAEATPEQVASVLAEYETDWRGVIENAGDCRFTWVMDDSPTGEMQGMSCYTREQTIGLTAQIVTRDWGQLEIPASMQDLVDDTVAILDLISEVDLAAVCGEDSLPNDSQECSDALGSRNFAYGTLEGQLDAWKPYL